MVANDEIASKFAEGLGKIDDASNDIHQISPDLEAAFHGVESALDRLYRLNVIIRNASPGQLMVRVRSLANDKSISSFEVLAYSIATTLYPRANHRLLEHVSASLATNYKTTPCRQDRERTYIERPWQQKMHKLCLSPGPVGREVPPTEPKSPRKYSQVVTTPDASLPPTTSIQTESASHPSPQAILDGAEYATCEWCLENHSANMFNTPSEWKYVLTLKSEYTI